MTARRPSAIHHPPSALGPPSVSSLGSVGSSPPWTVGILGSGLLHTVALAACAWAVASTSATVPRASDGGESIELTAWSEASTASSPAVPAAFRSPPAPAVQIEQAPLPTESLSVEAAFEARDKAPVPDLAARGAPPRGGPRRDRSSGGMPPQRRTVSEIVPELVPEDADPTRVDRPLPRSFEVSEAARPESVATVADVRIGIQTATRRQAHCPTPSYPAEALRQRWSGTTKVRVLVGPSGRVLKAELYRSSGHELLDKAALAAVRAWKFRPEESLSQFAVPITFVIEDEPRN